jgi:hypothetical protein
MDGITLDVAKNREAWVTFENETYILNEHSSKKLSNGQRLYLKDSVEDYGAVFTLGDYSNKVVNDGDEFLGEPKHDAEYEWVLSGLDSGEFAVEYVNSLTDADEALYVGDSFVFPSGWKTTFVKLHEETKDSLDGSFTTIDVEDVPTKVFMLNSPFEFDGGKDTNKAAFDGTNFYVKDSGDWVAKDVTQKINDDLLVGENNTLFIGGFALELDFESEEFSALALGERDISSHEDDILTSDGVVIQSPKDNFENNKLKLSGFAKKADEYGLVVSGIKV